jgi:hypothetical protein
MRGRSGPAIVPASHAGYVPLVTVLGRLAAASAALILAATLMPTFADRLV